MKYWNDGYFIAAVNESTTITQVLRKFNIPTNQGHYNRMFHLDIERLDLDISHFRLPNVKSKIPLNEIFIEKSDWKGRSCDLKKKLIKNNVLQNICSLCGQLPFWNERPLILQLDHINGINNDNRIENLRIVCPNCHTQTDTFSGRHNKIKTKPKCESCGEKHTTKSKLCLSCSLKTRIRKTKIKWPSDKELKKLIENKSYCEIGRMLGVSDNAIRRRLLRNKN